MSEMFDALRKAEVERQKRSSMVQDPLLSNEPTALRNEASGQLESLPDGFIRELGILRNSLDSVFTESKSRAITFTGAMAGEGSTTIAANFARFIAAQGTERVLLCEMNARQPALADLFSIENNLGVTDYFLGECDFPSMVVPSPRSGLDLLPIGRHEPSVVQVHLQKAFPRMLEEAQERYHTVIIDAPPIIDSPEAAPMAGFTDGVALVVHAGKTKREIVMRSIESVKKFNGVLLGVVLNRKKYYIPDFLYKRI